MQKFNPHKILTFLWLTAFLICVVGYLNPTQGQDLHISLTTRKSVMDNLNNNENEDQEQNVNQEKKLKKLKIKDIANHPNKNAIEFLVFNEIASGFENNSFKPDKELNRGQLIKILVKAQGVEPDSQVFKNCFPDVQEQWFAPYICHALSEGWVAGHPDGNFHPKDNVKKAEALKMLINSQGYAPAENIQKIAFFDVSNSDWYAPYLETAANLGILEEESGIFNASDYIKRGAISENIFRAIIVKQNNDQQYSDKLGQEAISSMYYAKLYVCNDKANAMFEVEENIFNNLQEAINEAETAQEDSVNIIVCSGYYDENIDIRTTKKIKFSGQSQVIIAGAHDRENIVEIHNACDDRSQKMCFGDVQFINIDFIKNDQQEMPKRAIMIHNNSTCGEKCDSIDRAFLTFSQGTISGFSFGGIHFYGQTDLMINNVRFNNLGINGEQYPAIQAFKGDYVNLEIDEEIKSSPSIKKHSAAPTCQVDNYADIQIDNLEFNNNTGMSGALIFAENAKIDINQLQAHDNIAKSLIHNTCSEIFINSSVFFDNEVLQMIYVDKNSFLEFINSQAYGNSGSYRGTIIASEGAVMLERSMIEDNYADESGGGIYYMKGAIKSIDTCFETNLPNDLYHEPLDKIYNFTNCTDFECDKKHCTF